MPTQADFLSLCAKRLSVVKPALVRVSIVHSEQGAHDGNIPAKALPTLGSFSRSS
jgi:hypothetical protein